MDIRGHQMGMIIFVRMNQDGTFATRVPIPPHEEDDPFCYRCGQKLMNIQKSNETCQGRSGGTPAMLPDLTEVPTSG